MYRTRFDKTVGNLANELAEEVCAFLGRANARTADAMNHMGDDHPRNALEMVQHAEHALSKARKYLEAMQRVREFQRVLQSR